MEDLQCLDSGKYLNDVIIDFYLKYELLFFLFIKQKALIDSESWDRDASKLCFVFLKPDTSSRTHLLQWSSAPTFSAASSTSS